MHISVDFSSVNFIPVSWTTMFDCVASTTHYNSLMFWCLSLCLPLCLSMSTHYTLSGSDHHSTVAFNLVVIVTRSDRLFTITHSSK